MIDWLNFWIGIVFAFAGISILISALRYYLQTSFGKYVLVVSAGFAFFLIGGNLILNSPIEFNPALHECTEIDCEKYDVGQYYPNTRDVMFCNWVKYWATETSENDTRRDDVDLEKEREGYELMLKRTNFYPEACNAFRDKTECEKGNPEYILEKGSDRFLSNTTFIDGYDFLCENCTDEESLKKGSEGLSSIYRFVSYGSAQDVCRKKTVEELERDYCKLNPKDTTRCYCTEKLKEVVDTGLEATEWVICYPDKNFSDCTKQSREYCVSAVPISEKLYCDENPTDAELCSCIEVIGFPKLVATPDTDMQLVSCSYNNNDSSYLCEGFINQSRFASDDYCLYHSTDSSCITNLSIEFIEKCVGAVPKVKE